MPIGQTYTYDPKLFSIIVGGKIISGFGDGTFIKLERNQQAFQLKMGTDGEGTRAKSNDLSGKLTITLMQSSPSNDDLSSFAAADQLANAGAVPCFVKDGSGRTVASCETAWVQKLPDSEFSNEAQTRVWVLETAALVLFVGGN